MLLVGCLAGLGGSYLSIVQNNVFVNNMVAGRGFLGVAKKYFWWLDTSWISGVKFYICYCTSNSI